MFCKDYFELDFWFLFSVFVCLFILYVLCIFTMFIFLVLCFYGILVCTNECVSASTCGFLCFFFGSSSFCLFCPILFCLNFLFVLFYYIIML